MEVYSTLRAQLQARNTWHDGYEHGLALLVDSLLSYWRAREEFVNDEVTGGKLVLASRRSGGGYYPNPRLTVMQNFLATANKALAAFGLTPIADAKLKAAPLEGIGELVKLLRGHDPTDGG